MRFCRSSITGSLVGALIVMAVPSVRAQLDMLLPGTPYTVDFNIGGSSNCTASLQWTNGLTIPYCYSDRPTYNYSNGCANTGGLHVAGMNGETALGGRSSNSTTSLHWGVRFRNSTGVPLGGLHVRFRAEQWGRAVSDAQNTVRFAYRVSPTPIADLTSGTYTNVPALDLTNLVSPGGCAGSNTAIDGNLPEHSVQLDGCISAVIAPGDEIMLRWYDVNDPCNDHMLCVDDLEVTGYELPVLTADGPTAFCAGSSVTLTVANASDVTWSTGATGSAITLADAGIYTATSSMVCGGPVVLSQEVVVLNGPSVTVEPVDAMLCPGSIVELTATSDGDGLTWSTGDITSSIVADAPGVYTVSVSNACDTVEASITIITGLDPIATILPNGTTELCEGESVQLTASGGDAYLWSSGATSATASVTGAGSWNVTVTNACGSDQASITTSVIEDPTVQVRASVPVLCGGDEALLSAVGEGVFTWSTGQSGSTITVEEPGSYTVTATNVCGSVSASITINGAQVEVSAAAMPQEGHAPLVVAFSSDGDGLMHAWDLGNGEASTQEAPGAIYSDPGIHLVSLTVTDPVTGCSAMAMLEVVVLPGESWVRVPNVFSPNGDGRNDDFRVEHEALVDLDCAILNRWGQEVGRLNHPNDAWNGWDIRSEAPEGTYYYVLHAKGADGRVHELNGSLTLLR